MVVDSVCVVAVVDDDGYGRVVCKSPRRCCILAAFWIFRIQIHIILIPS